MPVFSGLAFLTTALSTTLVSAGLSAAAAGVAANLVVGTTLSMITSALFAPKVRQPSTKYSQVTNQEIPERYRGYGVYLIGGSRAERIIVDGVYYQVILAHTGVVDSLLRYMIDDTWVDVDTSNRVVTEPFNWEGREIYHVWLASREGYPNQAGWDGSDPTGSMNDNPNDRHFLPLTEAIPKKWAKRDNFAGIACIFAAMRSSTLERYPEIFPNGVETSFRGEWRLSKVVDPRTGALAWSDNPSLCIRDYLIAQDGYRLNPERLNDASFAAFARICDEPVPLKGGGTQKRYTLNGVYSLQDEPFEVLGRMRATCDAELYIDHEGKIGIRGGLWEAPTVTITRDNILDFDLQRGSDRFQTFNELKITYTSPKAKYQAEEATRWIDPEDQARRGVISSEFNVDMVNTAAQARRLAKIYRAKENPRWYGTITTNLVGLRARYERIIRLVIPELGIDGPFLVESHGFSGDLTTCALQIRWLGPEAYTWNPTTEEDEEAPEIIDDDVNDEISTPSGVTLTTRMVGTPATMRVVATANTPSNRNLQFQSQIATGTQWDQMNVGEGQYEAVSGPVLASQNYRVRSRFRRPDDGAVSDWTESAIRVV